MMVLFKYRPKNKQFKASIGNMVIYILHKYNRFWSEEETDYDAMITSMMENKQEDSFNFTPVFYSTTVQGKHTLNAFIWQPV